MLQNGFVRPFLVEQLIFSATKMQDMYMHICSSLELGNGKSLNFVSQTLKEKKKKKKKKKKRRKKWVFQIKFQIQGVQKKLPFFSQTD